MAIYSSQRRCQEAINELWKFTANKTREELTTSSSMRILTHLRNDLLLQCSEMELAHRNHDPGAGNENNAASLRVNMIVKSTKNDIGQTLMELDDKLAQPTARTFAPPSRGNYQEPRPPPDQLYPARPPPHLNPPRTQQIPHAGRRPSYSTQTTATRQTNVRTVHHTPAPDLEIDYRRRPGTEPTLVRPMARQQPQLTQQVPTGHPNSEVFLKRSTTTSTARTSNDKWHRNTNNYPLGAMGRDTTDDNNVEYGEILKCHLCHHKVWGTWPLIQAHYRDIHGYTPRLGSSPSPTSSPETTRPRKKYNRCTPAQDETKAQQTRRNANQSDTRTDNVRTEYYKHGPQTENPPLLHTRRIRTQAERKIYENDVEPMKTNAHTYRENQDTQLRKPKRTIRARPDEAASATTDGGMATAIQRLGSLNFPPINPQNATEAYNEEETQPREIITLEVEDMPADVQRNKRTGDDGHETDQPSVDNPADAQATGDLHREGPDPVRSSLDTSGEPITNKSATPKGASNPTAEHNNAGPIHAEPNPKPSRKSGSLWESIGALTALAWEVSGAAKIRENDAPRTPPSALGMGTGAASAPESPGDNNGTGQEPRETMDRHVPQQVDKRAQFMGWQTTTNHVKYDAQPPQENPYDMDNRNIRVEVRTAADPEKAICEAIMLGKVDATGSYNVDGHAESIEELQERLRDLHAQKMMENHTTRPTTQPDGHPSRTCEHTTKGGGRPGSRTWDDSMIDSDEDEA